MYPDWLPNPLVFSGSSIDADYDKLYTIYRKQIREAALQVDGSPIIVDTTIDPVLPQYEMGFTHLVTRKTAPDFRTIDYERASKLVWIAPIIHHVNESEVTAFWAPTATGETLYLWLAKHDFIIILKWTSKAKSRKIIVTAFSIDSHRRRDYRKLYASASRIL